MKIRGAQITSGVSFTFYWLFIPTKIKLKYNVKKKLKVFPTQIRLWLLSKCKPDEAGYCRCPCNDTLILENVYFFVNSYRDPPACISDAQ